MNFLSIRVVYTFVLHPFNSLWPFHSSSSLVDSLFVSLVVCRYYIFIFNELALTNVIEHDDDDDVDDERSEKKSPREEKNEASMQNSPHIDLTANRVLRVVPIDNHRQRYCLISYWSSSFDQLCFHSLQRSCHQPLSNVLSLNHSMERPYLMSVALEMKLKYSSC